MKTLYQKIITLYPELATYNFATGAIELRDEGSGAFIARWEHATLTKPTQAQLDSIT